MITPIDFTYKKFLFPVGEMQVIITGISQNKVSLLWEFESCSEIVEIMLIHDALTRLNVEIENLELPYIPFSRQDRVNSIGEALSLSVFASIINSLKFKNVIVDDPHSDVSTALINNCIFFAQESIFAPMLKNKKDFYLISPDGGALKKIYKLAKIVNCVSVVECSKIRNISTGEITGTKVSLDDFNGRDCVIVDDICDGGKTFIEIAKILKSRNCGKVILMVTHGFFTKGLEVFKDLIDEIYTRKGRVDDTASSI